jgi:hypothetical protein
MSAPVLRQPSLYARPAKTPRQWEDLDILDSFEGSLSDAYDAPVDLTWTYPGGGSEVSSPCQCARIVSRDEDTPTGPRDPDADLVYVGRTDDAYQDTRALGSGTGWYREYRGYAMYRRAHTSYRRVTVAHVVDDFSRADEDPIQPPWYGSGTTLVSGELVAPWYPPTYHERPKYNLTNARIVATLAFTSYGSFGFGTPAGIDGPRVQLDYRHFLGASPYDWHLYLFFGPYTTNCTVIAEGYLPHPLVFGGVFDVDLRITRDLELQAYTTYGDATHQSTGANSRYLCAASARIHSVEGWW